jgi:DNA damage-inducible protein 1
MRKLFTDCQTDRALAGRLSDISDEISNAIATQDYASFKRGITAHEARERQFKTEEKARIARIMADPMSEEAQALMFQQLQEEQAQRNMMEAMEHNPEAFASVSMLYIDAAVNQVFVRAFVDSGAQTTIMSMACARRCNIGHLIDTRFTGIAKGVGSSKILGRIHMVPMQLGSIFIPISITILEDDSMEFLFGLDNLKRHRCCIDLNSNVLRVGEESIPFLGEADIKELHEKFVGGDGPADGQKPKLPLSNATTSSSAASAFPMPPPASGVFAAPPAVAPVPTAISAPGRLNSTVANAPHAWPESSVQKVLRFTFCVAQLSPLTLFTVGRHWLYPRRSNTSTDSHCWQRRICRWNAILKLN